MAKNQKPADKNAEPEQNSDAKQPLEDKKIIKEAGIQAKEDSAEQSHQETGSAPTVNDTAPKPPTDATDSELMVGNVETPEPANDQLPEVIQMTKNFRTEYPLPCRRDTSMSLTLKAGQKITDKYIIKHLINSDAPFIIK